VVQQLRSSNGCSPSFARRSVVSLDSLAIVATRLEEESSGARRAGIERLKGESTLNLPREEEKKAPAEAGANAEEIEHRSSSEARLPSPRPSTRQRRERLAWQQ
jgi:hypothetical protein